MVGLHPFSYSYNPENALGGILPISDRVSLAILVNWGVLAGGGCMLFIGFGFYYCCYPLKNFCFAWLLLVCYMGM